MKELFTRRSIRKYSSQEISPEQIKEILKAAMASPSARNEQPREFYVITNKEMIKELAKTSKTTEFADGAPLVIIPCYREKEERYDFNLIDLSACTENLLLAVTSLGLGACWCAVTPRQEREEYVEKVINIKEGLKPFALIPIGYPLEEKEANDRYEEERIHYID